VRADALRNRSAALAAAEAAYAEQGVDVPLNELARRAKIGNATLYRHFPTREALLSEVYAGHLERYCAIAEDAAAADDPVSALREWRYGHLRSAGDEPRSRGSAGLVADAVVPRRRAPGPSSPRHRDAVRACGG
jgi:AcrR family transcriptional regulator